MSYIKKLVLKGFKSFPKETEILFQNGMNVVVGPNGSGKSNLTDAICFVLGRLSAKSLRAAKSSNMIFAGTKEHKPSGEAFVKLVFDNSKKIFPLQEKEIEIERIVRRNGISIYKINNHVKTRQEILELLVHAGIDPYGFNIVLQGEIGYLVRMHPEERRKVIEEVAGISVYETRKEKSLKELEKTDEKLKEVQTILRERTSYLKNLEKERNEALRYKKLEENIKRYKASILSRKLGEKAKESEEIEKEIEKKQTVKDKLKKEAENIQKKINEIEEEINKISAYIKKSSGFEQENLNTEVSNLRAELAGLTVKKENVESKLNEVISRRERAEQEIKNFEKEIISLREKSPLQARKHKELERKKAELEEVEKLKKNFYSLKIQLDSLKKRIKDKEKQLLQLKDNSTFTLKEIENFGILKHNNIESCQKSISELKEKQKTAIEKLESSEKEKSESEKKISVYESEISRLTELKKQVEKLDICPLCKSKITNEHVKEVFVDCDKKISSFSEKLKEEQASFEKILLSLNESKNKLSLMQKTISEYEIETIKLKNINDRKEHIKRFLNEEKSLESEIADLKREEENLENKVSKVKNIEEKYDKTLLEFQEISSRTEDNIDAQLEIKERDLENTRLIIKQTFRDEEELKQENKELGQEIDEKTTLLEQREQAEKQLSEKFQNLIEKKDFLQKKANGENSSFMELQNKISFVDNDINTLKVGKARIDAEKENLDIDFHVYLGVEIINAPIATIQEKLEKTQSILQAIGSVNMLALKEYDYIKKQYDEVAERVKTLESEKEQILKIIAEIDSKKKKSFMKTLNSINELFERNFLQLSTKGHAFLTLENKEDPFSGGLNILLKVAKGKYFDISSLSGGEKTLVALSLIFAIQEYKPYSFYIFDEIDAALDKKNSERLAVLLKKHIKSSQYIIITHNDAIITESSILYGVSMQEGISKIFSMEV